MRTATDIEALLVGSLASLRQSLDQYWPTKTGYEVAEATPLFHVGRALADAKFAVYAEVPDHQNSVRIDLVGMDWEEPTVIAIEGKRLWNGAQGHGVANDLRRLNGLRLPQGPHSQLPQNAASFGCVIATTWKDQVASWWATPNMQRSPMPPRGTSQGWLALGRALQSVDVVGCVGIYNAKKTANQQYLLYAITKVNGGF